jgi:hypothetical protein
LVKARQKHEAGAGAPKLTGAGITREQHGPVHLTLKFGDDVFCKATLRRDAKPSEVAARLRKLADEVEALES